MPGKAKKIKVDLIVPAMNEELMLPLFYNEISRICGSLEEYVFTFIFVDDGSSDGTLNYLKKISHENPQVKYISFSKNFGKEAAIYAGLQYSTGDFVILMDSDLEQPPSIIPNMLGYVKDGEYEACMTKRRVKNVSKMFYRVNNMVSPLKLQTGATDYACMSRRFVNTVLELAEKVRFTKGLFMSVGYKVKWMEYAPKQRAAGRSKWNTIKLTRYAFDGITSFSTIPLQFAYVAGGILSVLGLLGFIISIIVTSAAGSGLLGFVTVLLMLVFLILGICLLCIGVLGSYVGRIHMEVKNRPVYIVGETNIKKTGLKRKSTQAVAEPEN